MATREISGHGGGAVADEDEVSTGRSDGVKLSAQLRGGFLAVESTEVAQEANDEWTLGREFEKPDRSPMDIEGDQVRSHPGPVGAFCDSGHVDSRVYQGARPDESRGPCPLCCCRSAPTCFSRRRRTDATYPS